MIFRHRFTVLFLLMSTQLWALTLQLSTDKARYAPGDTVYFSALADELPSNCEWRVHYYHLDQIMYSETVSMDALTREWSWIAPFEDFRGYFADVALIQNDLLLSHASIAVDVSSDWSRYPRYGFLSKYGLMATVDQEKIMDNLNRHHINGIQFYDWHWKHHKPLAGTVENPSYTWNEIAGRVNYRQTVQRYVDFAHERNMTAMAYNLIYGAWDDASNDGVQNSWRLYTDANASNADRHDLPDDWLSDIYLMDPSNAAWQNYLIQQTANALAAFDFDGWHIDQLGDRGLRYRQDGSGLYLNQHFAPFLAKIKEDLNTRIVFNAVDQYAQQQVAGEELDFLYTELWSQTAYGDLASVINSNNFYSSNQRPTVFAAYVNKGISGSQGLVNTPAVLYADAVIFANGGAHLELGEHYLISEYFPNSNRTMNSELRNSLISYYDFMTAYQNLLRDSQSAQPFALFSSSGLPLSKSAAQNKVWVFNRKFSQRQVFHFINFIGASTMDWRDPYGSQTKPLIQREQDFLMKMDSTVQRIWFASPDTASGRPLPLAFTQSGDSLLFSLPYLNYWSMLSIEFTDPATSLATTGNHPDRAQSFQLKTVYPNPFNASCSMSFTVLRPSLLTLNLNNILGQSLLTENKFYSEGNYTIHLNGDSYPSGIYFLHLSDHRSLESRKILLLK